MHSTVAFLQLNPVTAKELKKGEAKKQKIQTGKRDSKLRKLTIKGEKKKKGV